MFVATAAPPVSAHAPTPREKQTSRLRRDMEALTDLARQVKELDESITTLERQSLRLTDSVRLLRGERNVLSLRMTALSGDLREVKRSLCPASMCTGDILRLIFAEQSRTEDPDWRTLGSGVFSEARARAPFSVAAVCVAWRSAALNCPEIWTYVGLPDLSTLPVNVHTCHIDRVRVLLSRSGAMPLDILIENITEGDITAYTDILDMLYAHIHRWRKCELFATVQYPFFHKYLRGSTPLLEELHVQSPGMEEAPQADSWAMAAARGHLSHCPRLREAFLAFWMPFHIDSDRQSLQKLETLTLELYQTIPTPLFWRLFAALPALSTLDIALYRNAEVGAPSGTFELPALRKLVLRWFAIAIPTRFPTFALMGSVEHVVLYFNPGETIGLDGLGDFFDACAGSLHFLHVHDLHLTAADGAVLSRRHGLLERSLEDCTLGRDCLPELRDGLHRLAILRILGTTTAFAGEEEVEAFLDLVREKCIPSNAAAAPRNGLGLVDAFVEPACGLSPRDRLELQHILQEGRERLHNPPRAS